MQVPHEYRVKYGPLATDITDGCNGAFMIPHPKISGYVFTVLASDGEGWEHVSVTVSQNKSKASRCPTWSEMCYIKELFWGENEVVMQLHPAKEDYVNNHPFCLHLWRPNGETSVTIPTPPSILVGIKGK